MRSMRGEFNFRSLGLSHWQTAERYDTTVTSRFHAFYAFYRTVTVTVTGYLCYACHGATVVVSKFMAVVMNLVQT